MPTSSVSFPSTHPKSNGLQCGDLSTLPLSSASPLPLRGCGPAGQVPWDTGFRSQRPPPPTAAYQARARTWTLGLVFGDVPDDSWRHGAGLRGREESHLLLLPSYPLIQFWRTLSLQISGQTFPFLGWKGFQDISCPHPASFHKVAGHIIKVVTTQSPREEVEIGLRPSWPARTWLQPPGAPLLPPPPAMGDLNLNTAHSE